MGNGSVRRLLHADDQIGGNVGQIQERIRRVLHADADLPLDVAELSDDSNLYDAGMTSLAMVNVMLGLEAAFDLEFPDHLLHRSVFSSIASLTQAIRELTGERQPKLVAAGRCVGGYFTNGAATSRRSPV
jgi:acyl carrier protein